MAALGDIVVDCAHPASLARFWAGVLDSYAVAPYDDSEIERLAALGIDDPEDDPTVLVEGPRGAPRFFFVKVPEEKRGKNRLHLDLRADEPIGELARRLDLGATVVDDRRIEDHWVVLADPEGNEFCLLS